MRLTIDNIKKVLNQYSREKNPIIGYLAFSYKPFNPLNDLVEKTVYTHITPPRSVGTFLGVEVIEDETVREGVVELSYKGVLIQTFTI